MRKLAFILLALNFLLTPMGSSFAMAMGFSGEHVHFDATWHGNADLQKAPDDRHEHGEDASHEAQDKSTPLKHSHWEAHSAVFIVTMPAVIVVPEFTYETAVPPPSFPAAKHSYPPFRPPQTA